MLEAIQYICIELSLSPFSSLPVKSIVGYDSGLILDTWNGGEERDKLEEHYRGVNLVRVRDDKFDRYEGSIGYHVTRHVYVSMRSTS